MKLSEAKEGINRKVVYTPFKECAPDQREFGVITGVNTKFAFVRYGTQVTGVATNPEDIEFEVQ